MRSILAADVAPFRMIDIARLLASPSVDAIASLVLAAEKAEGFVGQCAREAVATVLARQHPDASADVLALIPAHLADHVNPDLLDRCGLRFISDGHGTYASIRPESEAVIGTAEELAGMFCRAALSAARSVAGDPNAPAEGRYTAAQLVRPRLQVVA